MRRLGSMSLVVMIALLWSAAPAAADHIELQADEPSSVGAGEIVEIDVVLRNAETLERVEGATVIASREATIVGVTGTVELASAVTDELGRATLRWQQRAGTDYVALVAYSVSGDAELESEPIPVVVVGPERQVVRSEAGVQIPGFGAWVLIGVIVSVWGIIQFALVGPMLVATRFEGDEEAAG